MLSALSLSLSLLLSLSLSRFLSLSLIQLCCVVKVGGHAQAKGQIEGRTIVQRGPERMKEG